MSKSIRWQVGIVASFEHYSLAELVTAVGAALEHIRETGGVDSIDSIVQTEWDSNGKQIGVTQTIAPEHIFGERPEHFDGRF